MTVLMAMRGFTTQNCRVACGNERGGVRRQRVQEAKVANKHPVHVSVSTVTCRASTQQETEEIRRKYVHIYAQ